MAQKKITDLQLIAAVTDTLNIPSDDTLQSYRFTALQMHNYLRPKLLYPASQAADNLQFSASVGSSALTIALKTNSGNDPSATDVARVGFRSSTLTSGAFVLREITAALSLVVSSGSTLGHPSNKPYPIYLYLIDSAGVPELAISSTYFNENKLVSTTAEGGAGAADSETVMYSTTSRSNVACRCIGIMLSTQTTAGTWAAVPTLAGLLPPGPLTLRASEFMATRVTSAPTKLGEYRSRYLATGSSLTLTDAAPTNAPSAADGFVMNAKAYNATGSAGTVHEWYAYVGKNKNVNFQFYLSTGRTGFITTDIFIFGSDGFQRGIMKGYDPTTGLAWLSTIPFSASNTSNAVGVSDAISSQGTCYFDIIVSDDRVGQ